MSGIEHDEHGNLVHGRSGEILKIWCEDNAFTGAGHYLEPSHPKKEHKKKLIAKLPCWTCKYKHQSLRGR